MFLKNAEDTKASILRECADVNVSCPGCTTYGPCMLSRSRLWTHLITIPAHSLCSLQMELDRERMFRVGLEGIKQVHITELLSTRDEVRQLRADKSELGRKIDATEAAAKVAERESKDVSLMNKALKAQVRASLRVGCMRSVCKCLCVFVNGTCFI